MALRRVEGAIRAVQRGTDRTAAELAFVRLDKEIAQAERELDDVLVSDRVNRAKVGTKISGPAIARTVMVFVVLFAAFGRICLPATPTLIALESGSSSLNMPMERNAITGSSLDDGL